MEEKRIGMTVEEVAMTLQVSRPTAYMLINREDFPKIRIGRRIIVPREGFERWIEENTGKQVLQ